MLPGILNQLGAESLSSLKKLASTVAGGEYLREYSSLVSHTFIYRPKSGVLNSTRPLALAS